MTTEVEQRRRLSSLLESVGLFADARVRSGAIQKVYEFADLEIALLITLGAQAGYLALADLGRNWSQFLELNFSGRDLDFLRSLRIPDNHLVLQRRKMWIEPSMQVDESLGEARFASFLNLWLEDMQKDWSLRAISLEDKFFPVEIDNLIDDLSLEDEEAASEEHGRFIYGLVQGFIDYGQFFEPLSQSLRKAYALPIAGWLPSLVGYSFERGRWARSTERDRWYRDLLSYMLRDQRWEDTAFEFHAAWKTLKEVVALLLEDARPSND